MRESWSWSPISRGIPTPQVQAPSSWFTAKLPKTQHGVLQTQSEEESAPLPAVEQTATMIMLRFVVEKLW